MPTATYRLQFRDGMNFDRAAELVPYLRSLGISHLYASPIFTAVSGSTHGYDVTRHDEIEPELGGLVGLERLSDRLKGSGMGLILDIVPNHMAASMENPWWRNVAEWGQASPFARHFDIDWRQRLTLPVLGRPLEEALAAEEIALELDEQTGSIEAAYFGHRIPLHPASYKMVLGPDFAPISEAARSATPESEAALRVAVRTSAPKLTAALKQASGDRALLETVLEAQPWRLQFWQEARKELSYRRFFEVTGLVGVRVEDPPVFADAHRLVLDLIQRGIVDGLRVDHVDGLADPTRYLQQLRAAIGPDIYLVIEKILAPGERLPESWHVDGTTGYEFIAAAAELCVDGQKAAALHRAYAVTRPEPQHLATEERNAKEFIVRQRLETELKGLARLAGEALGEEAPGRDLLLDAIAAVAIAFPVYRTYADAAGPTPQDVAVLRTVRERLAKSGETSRETDAVLSLLSEAQGERPAGREFVVRFQQMTGPVMAKAIEDTLFYRVNRLIALNEVGADPAGVPGSVEHFHNEMKRRLDEQPRGLIGSTTHDTKRGEDARARLYAISEMPEEWAEAVTRWRDMNRDAVRDLESGAAPEPETEWLLYQALAGVWPLELTPEDRRGLEALKERFLPYVEKALREAKLRTDWLAVDEEYEDAVKAYAAHLLSPENRRFLRDFHGFIEPLVEAGKSNSLLQTLVKLTAPGVPDIYQGSEGFDFSLADPDNRRPPDFQVLQERTGEKVEAIAKLLSLRGSEPTLFTTGEYIPVSVEGLAARHVVAFLRRSEGCIALTLGLRLPISLAEAGADALDETRLLLDPSAADRQWHDVTGDTGRELSAAPSVRDVLRGRAAAVLISSDQGLASTREADMDNDRNELIRARAHEIWEMEGRPEGRSEEHWRQAELEIDEIPKDNPGSGGQSGIGGGMPADDQFEQSDTVPKVRRRRNKIE